jgi:hypothetical protein
MNRGHISPMPGLMPRRHGKGPNLCKQGGAKRARHGNEADRHRANSVGAWLVASPGRYLKMPFKAYREPPHADPQAG